MYSAVLRVCCIKKDRKKNLKDGIRESPKSKPFPRSSSFHRISRNFSPGCRGLNERTSSCDWDHADCHYLLWNRGDINGKELTVYIIAEILGGIAAWHWYNLSQQKQTTTEKITHNSGIAGTENSR